MNHEKINRRQAVTVPERVTVLVNGEYFTVVLGDKRLCRHKCCNQKGGPKDQPIVDETDLEKMAKKYREQYRLHDRYNGRKL